MSLAEILAVAVAAAALWLVWDNLKAREAANRAMRQVCRTNALLFLDDTVSLASIRPSRDADGRFALRRTYRFDYSDTGLNRRRGVATLIGDAVLSIDVAVEPAREAD